jgi:radical SAM protein
MDINYTAGDFDHSPLMFYYEVTTACDLVCKHCRASAQADPDPNQLSTEKSKLLLSQVATFPKRPMVVLTGGDPLKRRDLLDLIAHGRSVGLEIALTPSATPLATEEALRRLRDAGIRRLGISLDGPNAQVHDAFRGWKGSFEQTKAMLLAARELGMAVQVNTTVGRRNVDSLTLMAEFLTRYGIAMWALFFLVPVGRGAAEERITPGEYESVFEKLYHWSKTKPFAVKTTEAPHYRRFVVERGGNPLAGPRGSDGSERRGHRAPLGVSDGKGVIFVSSTGDILPAGFLPIRCGTFPHDDVVEIYRKHPLFVSLRSPSCFKGKCGECEFNAICGGSRARAYAVTGDPLESEPDCVYTPLASS